MGVIVRGGLLAAQGNFRTPIDDTDYTDDD